jgi:hypothetical protein
MTTEREMKGTTIAVALALVTIILISTFDALHWLCTAPENPEFYVGVEIAYTNTNTSDVREMVDKVKNYTNLVVIGSIELTYNETALNESCDYIYNAGLKIVVLFANATKYNFSTLIWLTQAKQKYGEAFLGLYRYDEPGGDQLDNKELRFVKNTTNYADTAANYTKILRDNVDYYVNNADTIFTADYGLYWWDYKTNYTAIFAEFVGNQSRERHIALCRGAAEAHNKSWGVTITWKYDKPPYLENGTEMYDDLKLAYAAGAKYLIVFDYPKIGPYGTLSEDRIDALKRFWDFSHSNPQAFGSSKAEAAYVVPKDYGFGFRSAEDIIWGLFPADDLAAKIWNDVNSTLISRYDSKFDILFDDVELDAVRGNYEKTIFWNETVT